LGRRKRLSFKTLGFTRERPEDLLAAFLKLARSEEVRDHVLTTFGTKYVIDWTIVGPSESGMVRTVWFMERNTAVPRLVTPYPASREEHHEGA
jgi:hypothetical protein